MKKILKDYYMYIVIFLIFLFIGLFVPAGGDDWEISSWYRNEGFLRLICNAIYMWKSFNGRILNNLFDMFLGKYEILWAFSSALVHTLTIFISLKIIKQEKNKNIILLFLLFVLSVSVGIRREIQLHKVGNISYSIPTLLIFYVIYSLLNKNKDYSKKDYYCIGLLSMCSCLWIENLTMAISFFSGSLLLLDYCKTKKINKYKLFSLLGCILGCIILFSSPGFLNRYNTTTEGYTTIEIIKNNFPYVLYSITLELGFIYLIYSFVCIKLLKNKKYLILKLYYILLFTYLLITNLMFSYAGHSPLVSRYYGSISRYFVNYKGILTMLIELSMLASIIIIINVIAKKEDKKMLNLFYFFAVVSVAPMVLSPGHRNLILVIYSLFLIISYLYSKLDIRKEKEKYIKYAIILALLFRLENYHYVLHNAHKVELERLRIMTNFKNNYSEENNDLILPVYDDEIMQNLNSNYYDVAFKKYYFLDENTNIIYKDGFMFKKLNVNKNGIEVLLLEDDTFKYKYSIYKDNKLVYENNSLDNKLNYDFDSKTNYKVKIEIENSIGKVMKKEVDIYYED